MDKLIDESMIPSFGHWIYDSCSHNDNLYQSSILTVMMTGFSSKLNVGTNIKSNFNNLCINFLKDNIRAITLIYIYIYVLLS